MFEVLYLFVLVWAVLPLIRALMQRRGGDRIGLCTPSTIRFWTRERPGER